MKNFIIVLAILFVNLSCNNVDGDAEVYRIHEKIMVDGLERTYTINLPPNYYKGSSHSLVIALHGGGGNSAQFETTCKLTEKANSENFMVVYPNGTGLIQTWNAGQCCGYAMNHDIDDVKFISLLIDKLTENYKVNPKTVYATGHSNGGMMCYRLACELSDKIAAIAPNASSMVISQPCNPIRPVPILHMHSKLDQHVVYTGGYGNGVTGIDCPSLEQVFSIWSSLNNCNNINQMVYSGNDFTLSRWSFCDNNVRIDYYLTNDGGHGWPGGLPGGPNSDIPSNSINANDLLWDFFQQFQLP